MTTKLRLSLFLIAFVLSACVSLQAQAEAQIYTKAEASNIVTKAYQDVFGRKPDPGGLETYTEYLFRGKTEAWVRATLQNSPEAKSRALNKRKQLQRMFVWPFVAAFIAWGVVLLLNAGFAPSQYVLSLMVLLFPAVYFYLIWKYGVNVPAIDDFDSILPYMSTPFPERLKLLLNNHNEHRIMFTRLTAEVSRLLAGSVDFKVISFLGNMSLLGVFGLFVYELRNDKVLRNYLLIMAAIVFSPRPWISLIWAMVAVQSNLVHFFAFLSAVLFFSVKKRHGKYLAVVAAVCAVLTSGSGLFVMPAFLLTLLMIRFLGNKDDGENMPGIKEFLVLLIPVAIVLPLYFVSYEKPGHNLSIFTGFKTPLLSAWYGLSFLGSIVNGRVASPLFGVFGVSVFVLCTVFKGYRKSPVFYSLILFCLILTTTACLARSAQGLDTALAPRYRINSLMFFASLLAMNVHMFPGVFRRKVVYVLILSFVLWRYACSLELAQYRLHKYRKMLVVETAKWITFQHGLFYPRYLMGHAGAIFDKAVEQGVYVVPPEVVQSAKEYAERRKKKH